MKKILFVIPIFILLPVIVEYGAKLSKVISEYYIHKATNLQYDNYILFDRDTFYYTYTYMGDSIYYNPKTDMYIWVSENFAGYYEPKTKKQEIEDSIYITNFLKEKERHGLRD